MYDQVTSISVRRMPCGNVVSQTVMHRLTVSSNLALASGTVMYQVLACQAAMVRMLSTPSAAGLVCPRGVVVEEAPFGID